MHPETCLILKIRKDRISSFLREYILPHISYLLFYFSSVFVYFLILPIFSHFFGNPIFQGLLYVLEFKSDYILTIFLTVCAVLIVSFSLIFALAVLGHQLLAFFTLFYWMSNNSFPFFRGNFSCI